MESNGILITGAARSGTSLVAGLIDGAGVFGGLTSPPNMYNKKGMFENHHIRNNVVKPFLREIGADPMCQYPLPVLGRLLQNKTAVLQFKERFLGTLQKQEYNSGKWYYKGAKLCLMWPLYKEIFPECKYVIVRRSDDDIVNSCMRTGFMHAFTKRENQRAVGARNEAEGWHWWVQQHRTRFEQMRTTLQAGEVWPERMMYGDYSEIKALFKWLDIEFDEQKAREFIDPKLYKTRKKKGIEI